jgi:signal transduction histidine kinase
VSRTRPSLRAWARSRAAGIPVALLIPVGITLAIARLQLPAFLFEHLIVLLVVAFAVRWGLAIAALAAVVAVGADDVLLREPVGSATITGMRDVFDLVLFCAMAVIVSSLVARAREERALAEAAADRERRAREERDRVIAAVTHDLATPLSVLVGTIHFVRRSASPADITRLLNRLETATSRAQSLVKTLAEARALEGDEFALTLAPVDLRAIVQSVVQMLDRVSERHPVLLASTDAPVVIMGDAERLQRVLENLVNNAIKYSPEGGAVEVTVSTDTQGAVVRVRDYGIGISPEALPCIFEPSYRAPEAAGTAPGLGLGLSIARQIALRHGGTLEAAAADARGTMLTLRLPLMPAAAPAPARQPSRREEAGREPVPRH